MRVGRILIDGLKLFTLACVAVFSIVGVIYLPRLLSAGVSVPSVFSPTDFITIVLSALTAILAALAIILAIAGVVGYVQIKTAALETAERVARETVERVAGRVATEVATRAMDQFTTARSGNGEGDAVARAEGDDVSKS